MIVAKPRRPWYQFSLLGMLIVITLASVPLGWLAYERNEVRKRAAAIARIEELNGKVVFGQRTSLSPQWLRTLLDDNSIGEVVSVNLIGTNFTDADIVHVARLKALKVLSLSHCQISDDGLAQLAGLTRLEKLWLDHTNLTDAGLERLTGLINLEVLILDSTAVTSAGLVHLAHLPKLEILYLYHTPVTDEGLAHLAGLTKLERLELDGTRVTDAGLVHLAGMANLKRLDIEQTRVTEQGVRQLQQSLPNLEIYRGRLRGEH